MHTTRVFASAGLTGRASSAEKNSASVPARPNAIQHLFLSSTNYFQLSFCYRLDVNKYPAGANTFPLYATLPANITLLGRRFNFRGHYFKFCFNSAWLLGLTHFSTFAGSQNLDTKQTCKRAKILLTLLRNPTYADCYSL